MDPDEIRFSFLADDHVHVSGWRLADQLQLDPEAQTYRLVFAKFPFQKKDLVIARAALLQCVRDDRLTPELREQIDALLAAR
jgi:hypothetical protein